MTTELPVDTTTQAPLRNIIEDALHHYFAHLDPNSPPNSLYDFILREVEIPLFQKTLKFVNGNQSKAATMLGMSRNTLRRKIALYQL
jgi:Fis family transcriptional regulator